jgi:hypothetical protein
MVGSISASCDPSSLTASNVKDIISFVEKGFENFCAASAVVSQPEERRQAEKQPDILKSERKSSSEEAAKVEIEEEAQQKSTTSHEGKLSPLSKTRTHEKPSIPEISADEVCPCERRTSSDCNAGQIILLYIFFLFLKRLSPNAQEDIR